MKEHKIASSKEKVGKAYDSCKAPKEIGNTNLLQTKSKSKDKNSEEDCKSTNESLHRSNRILKEDLKINKHYTVVSEEFFNYLLKEYKCPNPIFR